MTDWGGPHAPRKQLLAMNIPADEVDDMIDTFEKLGAKSIKKIENPDGTFNIEVEFEE